MYCSLVRLKLIVMNMLFFYVQHTNYTFVCYLTTNHTKCFAVKQIHKNSKYNYAGALYSAGN